MSMTDHPDIAGFRAMVRLFGTRRALGLAGRIVFGQLRGAPFRGLPAAAGREERLTRRQMAPAVLLYRALRRSHDAPEALRLTGEVVQAGGVAFLRKSLGPLRRAELARLDAEGRERFVRERGEKFFNATMRWDLVSADEVRFTVTACRFPALCEAVGAPELAPLFCAVDAAFFGGVEPGVSLERPHTIAEGAETCPFTLRLVDAAPDAGTAGDSRPDHSPR